MYQAKRQGGARHGVVDVRERHLAEHHDGLVRDLRLALSRGELALAYQPIVNAADDQILGVEALVRWTHPKAGTDRSRDNSNTY